jgi:hypothetical protein
MQGRAEGLTKEGESVRKLALLTLCIVFAIPGAASADPSNNPDFNFSRTFEFDPLGTGCPEAQWANREGRADTPGGSSFGLLLAKNCPTATVASAGAVANSIRGQSAAVLGYDLRDDSNCGAGSPRFNLLTQQGTFHFVGGCSNDGEETPTGDGWTRYRFELDDPTETFPVVPPGSTIADLTLIVDEEGQYRLDNIAVDSLCAQKPGQSRPCTP